MVIGVRDADNVRCGHALLKSGSLSACRFLIARFGCRAGGGVGTALRSQVMRNRIDR
jgi:hypothetical protein